jgi:protein TonB
MKNSQESKNVRQNSTYTKSRKHEANLRRNPTLHFQIGLILSLLISIFFIEMRMPTKSSNEPSIDLEIDNTEWADTFEIEKVQVEKVTQKEQPKAQVQQPEDFEVVDNDVKDLIETLVKAAEPDKNATNDNLLETTEVVDPIENIGPIPVNFVQKVPIFPGCEGLNSNEERRDCMSRKISKIINRKFKTELGEELGLKGVNRIHVQFTINDQGVVTDMKARGPHVALENEAKRVIGLLPKMTPGKQGDKSVGVIYAQPITFMIED